jgi:phage-related protein
LGYGGTQQEMYRLMQDAEKLGAKFNSEFYLTEKGQLVADFADITTAIHAIQENMGIYGATALEAGKTIQGSVSSMKSAWQNLITGLADGNADIGSLIDNLVTTIVGDGTDSNLGVLGNILPAIERALGGAVKLIEGAAPKIIEILPGLVEKILPSLISAATDMVEAFTDVLPSLLSTVIDAVIENGPMLIDAAVGLINALITAFDDNYEMIVEGAGKIIEHLISGLVSLLPKILETGLNVLVSLADGIAENIDTLIPTIVDVVLKIVDILTQSDVLQNLLDAAFVIIDKLSTSIMEATPELTDAIMLIIEEIVSVLLKPENLAKLVTTAINLIVAIASGLISAIPEIVAGIGEVIDSVVQEWKNADWKKIGKDVLTGLWNGISDKVNWLKGKVTGVIDKIKGWFTGKDGFDEHSPSKWSAKVFRYVMDGGVVGLEDGLPDLMDGVDDVVGRVKDGMTIDGFGGGLSYGHSSGFGHTSIGNITINIDGAKYSNEQSLAEAVAEAIQSMTDRRAAVYA